MDAPRSRFLTVSTAVVISLLVLAAFSVLDGVPPARAASGSSLVQDGANETSCTGPSYVPCTVTVSLPSSVTSGDVLVVGVTVIGPAFGFPSGWTVSDSLGSSYSFATGVEDLLGFQAALIFDATLASSGADTVTVMGPVNGESATSPPNLFASVFEVSGVTTSSASTGTGSVCATGPYYTGEISTSSVSFSPGAFLLGVTATAVEGAYIIPPPFTAGPQFGVTALSSITDYATSGASSPTNFPLYVTLAILCSDEAGIALQPVTTSIGAPEFPMGIALLFTLMVPALLAIRKRTMSL